MVPPAGAFFAPRQPTAAHESVQLRPTGLDAQKVALLEKYGIAADHALPWEKDPNSAPNTVPFLPHFLPLPRPNNLPPESQYRTSLLDTSNIVAQSARPGTAPTAAAAAASASMASASARLLQRQSIRAPAPPPKLSSQRQYGTVVGGALHERVGRATAHRANVPSVVELARALPARALDSLDSLRHVLDKKDGILEMLPASTHEAAAVVVPLGAPGAEFGPQRRSGKATADEVVQFLVGGIGFTAFRDAAHRPGTASAAANAAIQRAQETMSTPASELLAASLRRQRQERLRKERIQSQPLITGGQKVADWIQHFKNFSIEDGTLQPSAGVPGSAEDKFRRDGVMGQPDRAWTEKHMVNAAHNIRWITVARHYAVLKAALREISAEAAPIFRALRNRLFQQAKTALSRVLSAEQVKKLLDSARQQKRLAKLERRRLRNAAKRSQKKEGGDEEDDGTTDPDAASGESHDKQDEVARDNDDDDEDDVDDDTSNSSDDEVEIHHTLSLLVNDASFEVRPEDDDAAAGANGGGDISEEQKARAQERRESINLLHSLKRVQSIYQGLDARASPIQNSGINIKGKIKKAGAGAAAAASRGGRAASMWDSAAFRAVKELVQGDETRSKMKKASKKTREKLTELRVMNIGVEDSTGDLASWRFPISLDDDDDDDDDSISSSCSDTSPRGKRRQTSRPGSRHSRPGSRNDAIKSPKNNIGSNNRKQQQQQARMLSSCAVSSKNAIGSSARASSDNSRRQSMSGFFTADQLNELEVMVGGNREKFSKVIAADSAAAAASLSVMGEITRALHGVHRAGAASATTGRSAPTTTSATAAMTTAAMSATAAAATGTTTVKVAPSDTIGVARAILDKVQEIAAEKMLLLKRRQSASSPAFSSSRSSPTPHQQQMPSSPRSESGVSAGESGTAIRSEISGNDFQLPQSSLSNLSSTTTAPGQLQQQQPIKFLSVAAISVKMNSEVAPVAAPGGPPQAAEVAPEDLGLSLKQHIYPLIAKLNLLDNGFKRSLNYISVIAGGGDSSAAIYQSKSQQLQSSISASKQQQQQQQQHEEDGSNNNSLVSLVGGDLLDPAALDASPARRIHSVSNLSFASTADLTSASSPTAAERRKSTLSPFTASLPPPSKSPSSVVSNNNNDNNGGPAAFRAGATVAFAVTAFQSGARDKATGEYVFRTTDPNVPHSGNFYSDMFLACERAAQAVRKTGERLTVAAKKLRERRKRTQSLMDVRYQCEKAMGSAAMEREKRQQLSGSGEQLLFNASVSSLPSSLGEREGGKAATAAVAAAAAVPVYEHQRCILDRVPAEVRSRLFGAEADLLRESRRQALIAQLTAQRALSLLHQMEQPLYGDGTGDRRLAIAQKIVADKHASIVTSCVNEASVALEIDRVEAQFTVLSQEALAKQKIASLLSTANFSTRPRASRSFGPPSIGAATLGPTATFSRATLMQQPLEHSQIIVTATVDIGAVNESTGQRDVGVQNCIEDERTVRCFEMLDHLRAEELSSIETIRRICNTAANLTLLVESIEADITCPRCLQVIRQPQIIAPCGITVCRCCVVAQDDQRLDEIDAGFTYKARVECGCQVHEGTAVNRALDTVLAMWPDLKQSASRLNQALNETTNALHREGVTMENSTKQNLERVKPRAQVAFDHLAQETISVIDKGRKVPAASPILSSHGNAGNSKLSAAPQHHHHHRSTAGKKNVFLHNSSLSASLALAVSTTLSAVGAAGVLTRKLSMQQQHSPRSGNT